MVPQAIAKPFTVAGELVTGRCRYLGFVAIGTADDVATATLYDGPAATGRAIDRWSFIAIAESRQWYGPQGILCEQGIPVGTITGALEGIIYYIPQTDLDGMVIIDESGSQRVIIETHNQVDIDAVWAKLKEQGY